MFYHDIGDNRVMSESENEIVARRIDGAPSACAACGETLCLRQQVINLALGQADRMLCLTCLAAQNEQSPEDVLESIVSYILSRDCFAKQWRRHTGDSHCIGCALPV